MKKFLKPANLPWIVLGAGALGLLLQLWLYGAGTDSKGLLTPWHPAWVLLWVLTIAVIALVVWRTRGMVAGQKYGFNFPASVTGMAGSLVGAVAMIVASAQLLLDLENPLSVACMCTGFLCASVLVFLGLFRLKGLHPSLVFHCLLCVHMMLRLICLYQRWSFDPQIQDFIFPTLANLGLMLTCYYRTAFDANMGKRRPYALCNLLTVYFCCPSLAGEDWLWHLCMAVWMITDLCSLKVLRKRRPAPQKAEGE